MSGLKEFEEQRWLEFCEDVRLDPNARLEPVKLSNTVLSGKRHIQSIALIRLHAVKVIK